MLNNRNLGATIDSNSPPPLPAPNQRSSCGRAVHSGSFGCPAVDTGWALRRACSYTGYAVLPGSLTSDPVTCKKCLWYRGAAAAGAESLGGGGWRKLQLQLGFWNETVSSLSGLAKSVRQMTLTTDPASRAALRGRFGALYEEIRSFAPQVQDAETLEIAQLCLSDARSQLLDILLEQFSPGTNASGVHAA